MILIVFLEVFDWLGLIYLEFVFLLQGKVLGCFNYQVKLKYTCQIWLLFYLLYKEQRSLHEAKRSCRFVKFVKLNYLKVV
jgi:hypothetical protein